MKQISAALLLETPKGFLFVHPTGKDYAEGKWDLPKGHVEEGETAFAAMKRELQEETDLVYHKDINPYIIEKQDFGVRTYNKEKNIHLFYARISENIDIKKLKCTSTFVDSYGNDVPENNDFKISFNLNYLFPRLKRIITDNTEIYEKVKDVIN